MLTPSQAGFDYSTIEMEVEAYKNMAKMDNLLLDPVGSQFLPIYNSKALQPTLGLPNAQTYTTIGPRQYELAFQTGVMDITCTGASPPVCT